MNDSRKRLIVRNLLREWNCDVVCLQETKLIGIDRQLICSLWSCPYVDWVALDADQTAGGVLMMWDRRALVGGNGVSIFRISSVAGFGGWFYLGMFYGLWLK